MLIPSFTIDHNILLRGIYVSRKDQTPSGDIITTFDIRMREPNRDKVMSISSAHTQEHLGATYLRTMSDWSEKVVYFGPMGCRTGHYLILQGDLKSNEIIQLISEMFKYIANFEGVIPGAEAKECGNYLDHHLESAKQDASVFYNEVLNSIEDKNLIYPEQGK